MQRPPLHRQFSSCHLAFQWIVGTGRHAGIAVLSPRKSRCRTRFIILVCYQTHHLHISPRTAWLQRCTLLSSWNSFVSQSVLFISNFDVCLDVGEKTNCLVVGEISDYWDLLVVRTTADCSTFFAVRNDILRRIYG